MIEKSKNKPNMFDKAFLVSFALQLGFSLAIPLVIFIGGGIWLDKKFHLSPTLTIGGAVLGFIVSNYILYKNIKPYLGKK